MYKDMLGGNKSLPRSELYVKKSTISWRISKPLDLEKNQLFHNIENTNYMIYGYVCCCGNEDIVLSPHKIVPDYTCPECGNSIFYDGNFAHTNLSKFLEKYCTPIGSNIDAIHKADKTDKTSQQTSIPIEIVYDTEETISRRETDSRTQKEYFNLLDISIPIEFIYTIENQDGKIISGCKTDVSIPKDIDFSRGKIYSKPVYLFDVAFYSDGTTKESHKVPYEYMLFLTAYRNLNDYINEKGGVFGIERQKSEKLTYKNIAFFLQHPWLKEYDFYLWDTVDFLGKKETSIKEALVALLGDRNQKSLRKALFKNYMIQMDKYGRFEAMNAKILLEVIEDTNLAVRLLEQDIFGIFLTQADKERLKVFLIFLKKYYSETQIMRFMEEIVANEGFLLDTLREFTFLGESVNDVFVKPKCTLMALHNHFFLCARKKRYFSLSKERLYYEDTFEKAQLSVNGYVVKLPYAHVELFDWSVELKNCLSGRFNAVHAGEEVIYGFFKNEEIEFALSIKEGNIEEARSKYNKPLNFSQNEAALSWFKLYLENELQSLVNNK